jgi:hypothetical protein
MNSGIGFLDRSILSRVIYKVRLPRTAIRMRVLSESILNMVARDFPKISIVSLKSTKTWPSVSILPTTVSSC